ncbi:hypothetical protein ABH926_006626 [Catenulispora sp. GP43]
MELDVGGDQDREFGPEAAAVLGEGVGQRVECGSDRFQRGRVVGGGGDAVGEQSDVHFLAGEQDFALVGEVAEEGGLGQAAGPVGDLRDGGGLVSLLGEQVHGGSDQAFACVRFPSGHGDSLRRAGHQVLGLARSDDAAFAANPHFAEAG